MQKSSYWQDRFIKEEQRVNNDARAYIKQIEKQYDIALSNIEKDINNWYMRIAKNNQVNLLEAKRMLSAKELAEFKWGINEYIKAGETNSSSPIWIKELENASARVHISRLEALKLQIQNEIESLYGTRDKQMQDYLVQNYGDTYYHTAYEIQKGIGLGSSVYSLDTNKVNQIIHKPWAVDGKNFSERIWEDKNKLINTLHNKLTQSFIRGSSPYRIVSDIAKEFNVKKSIAGRLVMTESAAYSSKAQERCYKDLGIDQYEIVATLDRNTSSICQEMDGKVFSMKEYEVGVTANPFHPNCRTVTAPYFADDTNSMRAMRNKDGKIEYVSADMKYKEWFNKYVQDNEENDIIELDKGLYPDELANVKRGKIMTRKEANEQRGNPKIKLYLEGRKTRDRRLTAEYQTYTTNCQTCVVAFEARLRGYDVEALPNTKNETIRKLSRKTNLAWIDPKTGKNPVYIKDDTAITPKKYFKFLQEIIKEKERYTIEFTWKGSGSSGHIISLDRDDDGKLRFYDPQIGRSYNEAQIQEYLKNLKYVTTVYGTKIPTVPKILRIDDKYFDKEVVNKILKGADKE